MTSPIFGPDRWLYPIEVTSSTDSIQLVEDTTGDGSPDTAYKATINIGTYYGYKSGITGYNGILGAIETKLNNVATQNTYTIIAATPPGSSLTNSGIEVVATNSSPRAFQLKWDAITDAQDPAWLGWGSATSSTAASNTNTPTDRIASPYSILGKWQSITAFSDNTATRKDRDEKRWLDFSSDDQVNATQIEYGDPTVTDEIMYPQVPAAAVREQRGDDADYASQAGLPTGDTHNALYDLWVVASSGDKGKVIVVHNEGDDDHIIQNEGYEIGYLDRRLRQRFSQCYQLAMKRGELYDLTLKLVVTTREVSF